MKRAASKTKDPTPLQRVLVRHGIKYDEAAAAIRNRSSIRLTAGYLCKVANGMRPSLALGREIVRWAHTLSAEGHRKRREELTLADLGIEVE